MCLTVLFHASTSASIFMVALHISEEHPQTSYQPLGIQEFDYLGQLREPDAGGLHGVPGH